MISPTLVTDSPLAHWRWLPPAAASTGRCVVLLHGVGGGRDAWGAGPSGTGAVLAAAGFEVLAVDLPGYGLSAPLDPCTLAGMAQAVLALIASRNAGPAVVVGHSMGGMVAQTMISQSPESVSALVLAGTSPAFGKPDGDWQRGFLQSRFAPLDAGVGMAGLAASLVPSMVGPGTAPAVMAAAQALMAGVPEAGYRRAVAALVGFDGRARLAAIAVPTLVITGECDATAPPEVARRMAERIAGAQCVILAGAGHLLTMEQPEAFNTAVLAFLQRH